MFIVDGDQRARRNLLAHGFVPADRDAIGVGHVASHGNFLLVHVGAAATVYEALLRQGVIVRAVANYGLPEHLRVSVGLPVENQRFLVALRVALGR